MLLVFPSVVFTPAFKRAVTAIAVTACGERKDVCWNVPCWRRGGGKDIIHCRSAQETNTEGVTVVTCWCMRVHRQHETFSGALAYDVCASGL